MSFNSLVVTLLQHLIMPITHLWFSNQQDSFTNMIADGPTMMTNLSTTFKKNYAKFNLKIGMNTLYLTLRALRAIQVDST